MLGERQYQPVVTNLAIVGSPSHRLPPTHPCLVLGLIAPGVSRIEGNGWGASVRVHHIVDRCLKTCWTPTERRCRDGIGALCGRRGAHRETQPDRNRQGPRHLPELALRTWSPS